MAKTLDDYFNDWESHVFGFGYGTGEPHVLGALKGFMELCHEPNGHSYRYETLEAALTPTVAWLLINALCHADIIEYGTSPRYGWLTQHGEALQAYLATRTVKQLEEAAGNDERICYPDYCNCTDTDRCHNPFWRELNPKGTENGR